VKSDCGIPIMLRADYQEHFKNSFGARWKSMPDDIRWLWWNHSMSIRETLGLPIFPNPWAHPDDEAVKNFENQLRTDRRN